MSVSLPAITSRLASGNFSNLQSDRAAVAKLGPTVVREVEVAYANGCLSRVRATSSFTFWDELMNLIDTHEIALDELGTTDDEYWGLAHKVQIAFGRWAFQCFRGSLSPFHFANLQRALSGRRITYEDIGTSRFEITRLECLFYSAAAA
jgi:hypothetical protein